MQNKKKIAIVGGGAAGFMAGISAMQYYSQLTSETKPELEVVIFEKAGRALRKVMVTGGGRCNLTNSFNKVGNLSEVYPRGDKLLKKLFNEFGPKDTRLWFEEIGVELMTQKDQRVFPKTEDSETVVLSLLAAARRFGVRVVLNCNVEAIEPIVVKEIVNNSVDSDSSIDEANDENSVNNSVDSDSSIDEANDENSVNNSVDNSIEVKKWRLNTNKNKAWKSEDEFVFDAVIMTTGGQPESAGLQFLENLEHKIVAPVPSLFTMTIPHKPLRNLMGTTAENVILSVPGEKIKSDGSLLITHWGISGPATLKLSSYGARVFAEKDYKYPISINWTGQQNSEIVRTDLNGIMKEHAKKQLTNLRPYDLPTRLWDYILDRIELDKTSRWLDLSKKSFNRLVEVLTNDIYQVSGRAQFKEEFVTSGGVSLKSVKPKTLESKVASGLYFAGELLDIDAVTGGFNLQAAWTTGYISGLSAATQLLNQNIN